VAADAPLVSYVMPVLNEADALEDAVAAVLAQDYPGPSELVLALGPSSDGTERIAARIAAADPRVRTVANPHIHIPLGLNLAIESARGDIVVRVDAHTELPLDYTRRMVAALDRTGAANVGGVMRAVGEGPVQGAIARVYNSPLGLGGGVYHGVGEEGEADSAYLGVFRREVLRAVGGYDESLRRGEDYDLNQRIRAAGHGVWYVPSVAVSYRPRSSWNALAKQMWATGAWRGEMVRRGSPTPVRYFAAPALVAGVVCSVVVAVGQTSSLGMWPWSVAHAAPLSYALFLCVAAPRLGGRGPGELVRNARALATVHLSWGAGFLRGLVSGAGSTVDRSRVLTGGRS
jgi:succinoglycan biosynthesis protein ExoA